MRDDLVVDAHETAFIVEGMACNVRRYRNGNHLLFHEVPGGLGASHSDTFLGERYRRIARHRGKKKAMVAASRSILAITWHLLSDPGATYTDLGPGYYDARISHSR